MHPQEICKEACNGASRNYSGPDDRRGEASRDETAHKVAWSAVKRSYEKAADGKWNRK